MSSSNIEFDRCPPPAAQGPQGRQRSECNTAQEGVSFSVAELHDVSHIFVTVVPQKGNTCQEQARNALEAIDAVTHQFGAQDSVLHLTVFRAEAVPTAACRQVIRNYYGEHIPATSYIPQPPCDGSLLAIEALVLGHGREKVTIHRHSDQLVVAEQDGLRWVYADYAIPRTSAPGIYEKTICSYQHLRRLLPQGRARLDQVMRAWLYLGGIVYEDGPNQRYKELNRARADLYQGVPFLAEQLPEDHKGTAYPACTGIGTDGRSMSISALALVSDNDDVVAVPLENPRQTAAYAYNASYSPRSPKFSRGLAVSQGKDTTLFISGTASIINSETQHPGDAVAQTHETLKNIAALISEDNLARHGLPGEGTTLESLGVARVYIKDLEDYPAVREVCERELPGVPMIFVVADVCRPDLLVEIEGIAFSHRTGKSEATGPVPIKRCGTKTRAARQALALESQAFPCPDTCPERCNCPHAVLAQ